MNKITLKEIINWAEKENEIVEESPGRLVYKEQILAELLRRLHQLEEEIESRIKQLQDMAERDDYWEGSLDTYREILGEEDERDNFKGNN